MAQGLPRFLLLFAALYAAFGAQSPYLPRFLETRGLSPAAIGLVLAAATAVKLAAGPAAGRLADRGAAHRAVFTCCALAASALGLALFANESFAAIFALVVLQAAALAALAPLADSLALASAAAGSPFKYGWVRGAGSAACIAGSLAGGAAAAHFAVPSVLLLAALLFAVGAAAVAVVPPLARSGPAEPADAASIGALLRLPAFRRIVLVAALVLGSHAMHDGFAVIRWHAAGIGAGVAGLLWSEQVAGEVLVFLLLGPFLLDRLGPARAMALAAAVASLRWAVLATTASLPAMALEEPLHGFSFALLHLAAMRLFAELVPRALAATALALYGTVGIGAATALVTLLSGPLYGRFGAAAFWAMTALALAGLVAALRLGDPPRG